MSRPRRIVIGVVAAVVIGGLTGFLVGQTPPPAPPPSPPAGDPSPSPGVNPPPEPSVRFFALGDTGTGSPDQARVAAAIQRRCEAAGCDFGLLLGDNFYPAGVTSASDAQWEAKFERPYAALLAAGIPFYVVLGNHDYADGADWARGAHQLAYAAEHPFWRLPDHHYTFEHGSVLFIALDTQRVVLAEGASTGAQRTMIETALAAAPRPWVVAFGHHPYVSNGPNGNAGRRLAAFLEEKACRAADLYLAGHDHNLQVLDAPPGSPCRSLFVVSGGGGYATYGFPGGNASLFQAQTFGFAYVTIDAARLGVEIFDADGQRLYGRELPKTR